MHFTLCDLFSDLTANAVEAGANTITVELTEADQAISLRIEDNGKGMEQEQLSRATDPFYSDGIKHPRRKIGLGIPFLIQTAESTGGTWNIVSKREGRLATAGKFGTPELQGLSAAGSPGTTVACSFDPANIDLPPVGDVAGFFRQILTFDGIYEMVITYGTKTRALTVRRSELLEALGLTKEGSFTDAGSLSLLGQYLKSLLED